MLTSDSLALPATITRHLEGAALQQVTIGLSGTQVYRAITEGHPDRYLKLAYRPFREELDAEAERLTWLRGRMPVPHVLAFARENEYSYLLLSEIPGLMACDPALAANPHSLVRFLAAGLRQIHTLSITDCPFDMQLERRLAEAERRMRAGLVDEEDFDEFRQGLSAETFFEQLVRDRPVDEDIVFTHGDYCLPNILIDPQVQRITGFIDWGRAGIADRYQDLALAVRSIEYNFGHDVVPLLGEFWDTYGIERPDPARVAYYQLLDEFF